MSLEGRGGRGRRWALSRAVFRSSPCPSSFFRDMLLDPKLKAETEGNRVPKPIPIDACARDVRLFLDYMHQVDPAPPAAEWDRLLSVIRLCELFGCSIIVERITIRLPEYASAAPWEIFCLASKLGMVNVARDAIKHFGNLDFSALPHNMPLAKAEKVCLPYLLGLFRAMGDSSGTLMGLGRPQMGSHINYPDVSRRFQPLHR